MHEVIDFEKDDAVIMLNYLGNALGIDYHRREANTLKYNCLLFVCVHYLIHDIA